MPTRSTLLVLALAVAGAAGCGVNSVGNAPVRGGNAQYGTIIRDAGFWQEVKVIGANEAFQGDVLTVFANLRNQGGHTRDYEYKFDFYDDQGRPVGLGSPTQWRRGTLRPGETASVVQSAGSPDARRWSLQLRKTVRPAR